MTKEILILIGPSSMTHNWVNHTDLPVSVNVHHVHDLEDIRGYKDMGAHLVGEYWLLDDFPQIEKYCKSHNITFFYQ